MTIARTRIATAAAAFLLLAACATPAGAPEASTPDASPSRSPFETVPASPSADAAPDAPDGLPQVAWDEIMDDLSRRVDGPVGDATVLKAEPMTWNDGSLGCPQAG